MYQEYEATCAPYILKRSDMKKCKLTNEGCQNTTIKYYQVI